MMGMCTCASNIKYIMVALLKNHTIAGPFGIHEVRTGYTAIGKETRWRCSPFTTEDSGLTGSSQIHTYTNRESTERLDIQIGVILLEQERVIILYCARAVEQSVTRVRHITPAES